MGRRVDSPDLEFPLLLVGFLLCLAVVAGESRWASAYSLPTTGQTLCYSDSAQITCPQAGEDYFGQDGYYQAGMPMSYTVPGDGTVSDNVTGLLWDRNPSTTQVSYTNAFTYCGTLSRGGYGDWRVPYERELVTLIDLGTSQPTWNSIFSGLYTNAGYFSANAYAGDATKQVGVYFRYGNLLIEEAADLGYVRCVHGDAVSSSFTNNGDGTVSDTTTGLLWEQEGSASTMSWKDALAYCEARETAGFTDWRLPNYKELLSIVDYTKYSPAIYSEFSANSSSYWTSSTRYGYPNNGIYVSFDTGYASYYYQKTYTEYARCVRGGTTNVVVAVLSGTPPSPTPARTATITVGGSGVVAYKYSLDSGGWSEAASISTPIALTGLSVGNHSLSVIGENGNGVWQSTDAPTTAAWTVIATDTATVPLLLLGQ
ncbi:MAG: DUF1566 domain-containing protein [Solidesulfovibrio sp. DCME]|uniref:Lcl C-terminal domain-containing protein n=1 Tax=Solidesulfovibrio sp. DCME TaxID=3447380 RepID=UPI003D0AAE12